MDQSPNRSVDVPWWYSDTLLWQMIQAFLFSTGRWRRCWRMTRPVLTEWRSLRVPLLKGWTYSKFWWGGIYKVPDFYFYAYANMTYIYIYIYNVISIYIYMDYVHFLCRWYSRSPMHADKRYVTGQFTGTSPNPKKSPSAVLKCLGILLKWPNKSGENDYKKLVGRGFLVGWSVGWLESRVTVRQTWGSKPAAISKTGLVGQWSFFNQIAQARPSHLPWWFSMKFAGTEGSSYC